LDKSRELRLLSGIKANNKDAFKEIFEFYYSRLCCYAEKLTGRKEIAEEIVQNVFLIIWGKRNSLAIETSLKAYLFRATHNNSIKYLQAKKIESDYLEDNKKEIEDRSVKILNFELIQAINRSIDQLPEKCREIFILSRFEQLKHNEIAAKLGISAKTVEVQIRKANIRLREKLKEFMN